MDDISQNLCDAAVYLSENNFEKAIEAYKNILATDKNNIEALKGIGMSYFNIKENKKAAEFFKNALEVKPDDATSLYYLASLSALNKNQDDAITYAKKVIELRPDYANAYKMLFSIYMGQKRLDDVLALYKYFSTQNVKDTDDTPYFATGTVLMLQKKYEQAIDIFKIAKKIAPNKPQLLNNLGVCYMSLKDYDSAINYFQQSATLDATNSITFTDLGTAFQLNGNLNESLVAYRKAFELEPENLLNLLNVANISNILKNYALAIEAYEKILKINPQLKEVQTSLIGAYVKNNEPEKAINLIDVALQKTPKNVPLLFKKAKIFTKIGDYNAAGKVYEQILSFKKTSATIYHAYGILFTKMKNLDKALEMFNKSTTIDPNNAHVHKDLAVIFLLRNQIEYAKDEFEKALQLRDKENIILKECADFYYSISDFRKADDLYRKSIELESNPYTSLSFGINLIAENKLDEAFAVLEPLLTSLPENAEVLYNLARIMYAKSDFNKATRLAKKAYFVAPTIEVANLMGLSLKAEGDYKGAANIFEKIIEQYPLNEFIYKDLAECYEKMGENNALMSVYLKANENFLYDEQRTLTLVKLLNDNGKTEEAKQLLYKTDFEHPSDNTKKMLDEFKN